MTVNLSPETEGRIEQSRLRYERVKAGAVVVTAILIALGVARLNGIADDNRATNVSTSTAVKLLVECTTNPAERTPPVTKPAADDCYVRQQKGTADIVGVPAGQLSPLTYISAACGAANPGDIPATRACLEKGLRGASVGP